MPKNKVKATAIQKSHHETAKSLIQEGKNADVIKPVLVREGLTLKQATAACREAHRQLRFKVQPEHHARAEELFTAGTSTPDVQKVLMKEFGFTKSQANAACRTARKHLGIYKKVSQEQKEAAQRARDEANKQAETKTEVSQD